MSSNLIYSPSAARVLNSIPPNEHTAGDRTPYCYLIGWTKQNLWYYGRRTAEDCHPSEFWKSYFTSSKQNKSNTAQTVDTCRHEYGEPDVIEIRRVFSDIVSCRSWENSLLTRINAAKNPKFLNRTNGDKNYDTTGKVNVIDKQGNVFVVTVDDTRLKTGELFTRNKGKTYEEISGEELGKKRRERMTGENNPFFGKKHSEEFKLKQSEKKSGENGPMYGRKGKDHPSFGLRDSEETRKKKSIARQGNKNPKALLIHIFDANDNLMFVSDGNFADVCKINDLPGKKLHQTYKNNTKILYKKRDGRPEFNGWYARIVDR